MVSIELNVRNVPIESSEHDTISNDSEKCKIPKSAKIAGIVGVFVVLQIALVIFLKCPAENLEQAYFQRKFEKFKVNKNFV